MAEVRINMLHFAEAIKTNIPLDFLLLEEVDRVALQSLDYYIVLYTPGAKRIVNDADRKTIHIDYDLIQGASEKLLARLRVVLGFGKRIYARQTVVARIDKRVTLAFLEEHHLNLPMSGKYRYGLYHKGELLSIAVFSGGRKMKDTAVDYRSFELIRFCHKQDYLVVGGLSKLLKAFEQDFEPGDIMTYADLDWCQDSSLTTIGFEMLETTLPQRFLVKKGVRTTDKIAEVIAEEGDYWVENKGSIKLKLIL